MAFDYFYEGQAEEFVFYRIPKVLFTDLRFMILSTEAKVVYGLLLDRVALSRQNNWIDDEGRVYIIFTITSIMEAMSCSNKSAIKYLQELQEMDLIERVKRGQGKPAIIYVKKFIPVENVHVKTCKSYTSRSEQSTGLDVKKVHSNNTNNNNTDLSDNNLILSEDEMRMRYESYILDNMEIACLKQEYPYDGETIDGIVGIILDVLCSSRKTIRISGEDKPINVVKAQFMKLNVEHLRYVMMCLKSNTTKVRNIKQYLLAALYNAPATIGSYYQAEVNHDMASGVI